MGKQQTKPHAAFGNLAILDFQFVVGLTLVIVVELIRFLGLFDLLPDLIEFVLGHPRRNVEVVALGELVEQLTLGPLAGQAIIFLTQLLTDSDLEGTQVFHPQRLGEFVIDGDFHAFVNFLNGAIEHGVLTGKIIDPIICGE